MSSPSVSKKSIKTSLLCLFCCGLLYGQNLVPNPGFETYTGPPTPGNPLSHCESWSVVQNCGGASPDYFRTDSLTGTLHVPSNNCGWQMPFSGEAYVGIYCYGDGTNSEWREYIQSELYFPLDSGETYLISAWVSRADYLSVAVDNFGISLTQNPWLCDGTVGALDTVVEITSKDIISDTANWVEISKYYCAKGGESYITLGNFGLDGDTDTVNDPSAPFQSLSYYYIDSISVSPVTIPINLGVSISGDTLVADQNSVTYQWLDCANGYLPISFANNQTYTPVSNGSYAVELSNFGCLLEPDTSACINLTSSDVAENNLDPEISLYPNPTNGKVYIEAQNLMRPCTLNLYTIDLQLVQSKTINPNHSSVSISTPAGIYLVEIFDASGLRVVHRVIKN